MRNKGQGFVFSETGGDVPVNRNYIYNGLRKALQNIGISELDTRIIRCIWDQLSTYSRAGGLIRRTLFAELVFDPAGFSETAIISIVMTVSPQSFCHIRLVLRRVQLNLYNDLFPNA